MFSDEEIAEHIAEVICEDRPLSFWDVFDNDGLSAKLHHASTRRWGFQISWDFIAKREYMRRWRRDNPAAVKAYAAKWRKKVSRQRRRRKTWRLRERTAHRQIYREAWLAENHQK